MRIVFTHNLQTELGEAEAEFDTPETVAMITASLRRMGHEVTPIEVSGPLAPLIEQLEAKRPDLVLNTAEGSHGRFREGFHPALFERLGLPYVGSDAYVCSVTLDKALTKRILAARGVPTPPFQFVRSAGDLCPDELRFPVIVKPNFEGSSKGITLDSVVERPDALHERVRWLLEQYPDGVLVESFVDGIDVVVPFVEGVSPETAGVLEPASYTYQPVFAQRKYMIYDGDMKQSGFDGLRIMCPAQIPVGVRARLIALSQEVYKTLDIRDFGRIDFRLAADGTPYFLEVNALPSLESGASIYLCGERAGVCGLDAVLEAVIASAARRYGMVASSCKSDVA